MTSNLMAYFLAEATELLKGLTEDLLAWEKDPQPDILTRILHRAHTLKGAASVVGQIAIADRMHGLETVLEDYRASAEALPAEEMSELLRSLDEVAQMLREQNLTAPSAACIRPRSRPRQARVRPCRPPRS